MIRSVGVVALALVGIFTGSLPAVAEVRVPRDSAIVGHGRILSTPSPATTPAREPPPDWTQRRPSPLPPFPDPGVRPLWIPDTYLWNGFRQYRVPGHWAW